MDLSKVYDCFLHGLLLVKLSAYGFDESAIALIASYLSDRQQHVKVRSTFTCYLKILRGVPQGSILGPILFKLFMNDLMFFIQETEVCNFANETTIYSCLPNFEEGTLRLSNDMHLILNWFKINIMVANSGKSQMFLGSNIDNTKITFMKSPPRLLNTGLVSSRASLPSWGESASLALVGHSSSDGVTIKMPYGVDVLHQPVSHPIFSYWVG